ncbi:potassium transport protein Kup [Variovorax sp. PBL-H6]|uniref:potassium transporter Kup n=1 Tax=Variovorax sp. PBL-H6 TaxID=434009 RepID=UPI001317489C|nr:potassium transporter Kup [Variovorax sp. PBL-H6]VTU21481.1 potassium transport protein Kup [Variovorax sp. PBL-H6]
MTNPTRSPAVLAGLTLGALGVVYGDIGTSPLYAVREVFHAGHVDPTRDNVLGVLSLIFWSLAIVVSLKYVALVLRANNNGEGGTMALMALASTSTHDKPRVHRALIIMGILGAALFYGDGIITPSISVLSAVEGLEVATPAFKPYVVPITLAVLTALYLVQRHGTGTMGKWFGPITLLWFASIAATGVWWIARNPEVLLALNPFYALRFLLVEGWIALAVLGAVFLAVTGAEALYADMGHFGKSPIRIAWFSLVWPALSINYFGQGALILLDPKAIQNPFFMMVSDALLYPMVALATAATVIASQATISGTFSVTKQAIQLGYLPRLRILHTSVRETGQIYIPSVNWIQYGAVVLAVTMFGSSSALATAYGIAVTATMVLTTLMTFVVLRFGWRYPLALALAATGFFLIIELVFFASNAVKVLSGGWFTLLIAGAVFTLMLTWKQGRNLLSEQLRKTSIDLHSFLDSVFVSPPSRVPGTAVFLTAEPNVTPTALLHNLKHNMVLHEQNLFVTVQHHEVPWVPVEKSVEVEPLGRNCWKILINFGFKNDPDVPEALEQLKSRGIELEEARTSYFLSRDIVVPTIGGGMAPWREKLFANLHRNSSNAAEFLSLPPNRVVELGAQVAI